MNTTDTTTNLINTPEPKFPRLAGRKVFNIRLNVRLGATDAQEIADWNDTTVAKVEALIAYDAWQEQNPVLDGPSYSDLPAHLRRGSSIVSEDTAFESAQSYEVARTAHAEGRTVWAGFGNGGWVAPEADEADEILNWLVG